MLSWLLNTFRHYFSEKEVKKDYLSILAPHIKDDIIDNLDVRSRLTLRKSSKTLRFFVENRKLHINQLSIRYALKYIELSSDDGLYVRYQDIGGGAVVSSNENMRLFEGDDFIELFKKDLLVLLINKKLTIGTLKIVHFRLNLIWTEELIDATFEMDQRVLEVFQNLPNQLSCEHLIAKMLKPKVFRMFFLHLNPNSIRSIKFFRNRRRNNRLPHQYVKSFHFNDAEVFESDQWNHLESIFTEQPISVDDLSRLTHANFVNLRLFGRFTVEQFGALRDRLLENPQLDQFKIRGTNGEWSEEDTDDINTSLNVLIEAPVWVHFPYPNNLNKTLMVYVTYGYIMFRGPCFEREAPTDEEEPYDIEEDEWEDAEEEVVAPEL